MASANISESPVKVTTKVTDHSVLGNTARIALQTCPHSATGSACRNHSCTKGTINANDYRIAVARSKLSIKKPRYDYYHLECFEGLVDISSAEVISRFVIETKTNARHEYVLSNKASQAVQDWLANKRAILGSDIYKKVRGPAAHKTTARVGEKRTREDAGIVTPEEEGEGHDEKRLETAEVQEILLSIATSHMAPVQSGVNNGQSSDTSQSDGDNGGPHGDVKPGEPGGTAVATQDGGLDSRHELSQILAAIDNAEPKTSVIRMTV